MGLEIFVHSIRQVFGNLGVALKISALLYIIQVAAVYFLGGSILTNPELLQAGAMGANVPWLQVFLALLIMLITGLWIAVAWHRYILRVEEPASVIPPFKGDRMLGYLGYSVLIGIILVLLGFVVGLVVGLLFMPFMSASGPSMFVAILMGIIIYVPIVIVGYRLSVVLPGAALGDGLGLGGAWEKTRGTMGTLLVLAVVSVVAAIVIDLPATYLLAAGSIPALIWTTITQWITLMVGVSILTTLYGVYVEGRQLNP